MADRAKGPSLAEQVRTLGITTTEDQIIALEMLYEAFSDRFRAVLDGDRLVLNLTTESEVQNREQLRAMVSATGFRFASCTPMQMRQCADPKNADILDSKLFVQLCSRIEADFTLNDIDLLQAIISHPHVTSKILSTVAALTLKIKPENIQDNNVMVGNIQTILQTILTHPLALPEVVKEITLIPYFAELVYKHLYQKPLIEVIAAFRKANLTKADIETMLANPEQYKTAIQYLDIIAPLLFAEDITLVARWMEVKRKLFGEQLT